MRLVHCGSQRLHSWSHLFRCFVQDFQDDKPGRHLTTPLSSPGLSDSNASLNSGRIKAGSTSSKYPPLLALGSIDNCFERVVFAKSGNLIFSVDGSYLLAELTDGKAMRLAGREGERSRQKSTWRRRAGTIAGPRALLKPGLLMCCRSKDAKNPLQRWAV